MGSAGDSDGRTSDRLSEAAADAVSGVDRREFLRTMAAGGYTVGVASWLGLGDVIRVGEDPVTIVTALVRSDPDDPFSLEERTRTVPAGWYAAVSQAFELNELLARSAIAGYLGSAVVPTSYDDAGARITVEVSVDTDSIREVINRVFDGFSVNIDAIRNLDDIEEERIVREPQVLEATSAGSIPGGVACETEASVATLGPALYDNDTEDAYFSTAEHAFSPTEITEDAPVSVPFDSGEIAPLGTVASAYSVPDVAIIDPNETFTPSSTIQSTSEYTVIGQLTKFGLADLVARGESIRKVGAMTGETTGDIQGIDAVSCLTSPSCRRGQLRWGDESDMTDGDSGSVSFYPDPEGDGTQVLVASFNNARTWWPGQSYVWGTAAHHFTDRYGYHF